MAVNRTKVLEAAQKSLSKGQYDKAIAEYQKLVAEDPRDVRTLLKIGDLHTRRNKPKDAIDIYEKVAELYAKQGFFLKAVAVYKQILKLDASQLNATLKLAQMYEELALASDALSTYEQAADALLAQGQTDKALETMQRMIALDGQNVAARIKFAEALSKADRPRDAASAFAEGARLLREQGRIDDYIRVVERQLYHDPDNVNIARELSSKYLERNDPKRALAKLQVCFKADPRDVQTLEMLAEAFRQLGQIPKTVSVLKEIARLHAEVNADEPRRRTLMRVIDLDPNDAEARQALAAPAGTPRVTRATEAGAGTPRVTRATEPTGQTAAQKAPTQPVETRSAEPRGGAREQKQNAPPRSAARAPDPELEEEFESEDELSLDDAVEDSGEAVLMVAEEEQPEAQEETEPTVESLLAEADSHEAARDYLRAEQALRNALLLDEELAEVHERLKDVYLATDRRVDAVRELLWLSQNAELGAPAQAVNYARAALQLAPRSDATRRRLEALGLDPDTGEAPTSQAEEVVFVDDSHEDVAAEPSRAGFGEAQRSEREQGSLRSAAGGLAAEADPYADPLDLPISPDDFDAEAPRPRASFGGGRVARSDLAALLDRPISASEFDADSAPELEYESAASEAPDVAALLDAPVSPDEFDAPPPRTHADTPAYDLLDDQPVDDFGLSDDRFDRSDLHEVSPLVEASTPAGGELLTARAPAHEPELFDAHPPELEYERQPSAAPVLQVVEDEESYDELLSEDIDLAPSRDAALLAHAEEPARELSEQSLADLDRAEALAAKLPERPPPVQELPDDDSDWLRDLPEPTVPAEPIPELIRRSSRNGLDAVGRHTVGSRGETARPTAMPPANAVDALAEPDEVITPEVQEVLDEAGFFASQGLLDEALEVVQEAILIYSDSAALKARLVEYETAADAQEALAEAREEEAALDESFDIAEQLASQLADVPAPSGHDEMVDVESVFAQFKKGVAAQIGEDDTDTHFDLGIAYKEMGLIDDAIGEFEISAKSAKRACNALTMVGMCHLEKGDSLKAVAYFDRALNHPTKSAAEDLALTFEIANAYELNGQLEKALACFDKVALRDRSFRGVMGRIDQLKRRGVSASASRATH